jgi:hypothetical protein
MILGWNLETASPVTSWSSMWKGTGFSVPQPSIWSQVCFSKTLSQLWSNSGFQVSAGKCRRELRSSFREEAALCVVCGGLLTLRPANFSCPCSAHPLTNCIYSQHGVASTGNFSCFEGKDTLNVDIFGNIFFFFKVDVVTPKKHAPKYVLHAGD